MPHLLPAERLGPLADALGEAGPGVGLAAPGLADAGNVPEPQVDAADAELPGQLVHRLLERPGALGMAGRAHRPCRAGVDEDVGRLRAHVRAGVEVPGQPVEQRRAAGRVGAAGAEAGELDGGQLTALRRADLDRHVRRRPVAGAQEGLLPRQEELDRPRGLPRQERRDHGVLARLELGAEATAHVVADDPDLGHGQAERPGRSGLDGVDPLGRLPQRQPVAVPAGDAAVQLERGVELALGAEAPLDDHIRRGEPGGHVTPLVGGRLPHPVAALVHLRRFGRESVALVGDEREDLVVDPDRRQGVPGLVRGLGGDRGHRLALVAADRIEQRCRDPAAVAPRHVLRLGARAGQHRDDAGQRLGRRGVDAPHPGVGVGAAQDGAVEHAGQDQVRRVDGGAAHALVAVDPRQRLADHLGRRPRLGLAVRLRSLRQGRVHVVQGVVGHRPPPFSSAARRTAFWMWA